MPADSAAREPGNPNAILFPVPDRISKVDLQGPATMTSFFTSFNFCELILYFGIF